jgi:hypothetical protein
MFLSAEMFSFSLKVPYGGLKINILKVLSQKGQCFSNFVIKNFDLVPESKSLYPNSINIDPDPVVSSSVLNYLYIAFLSIFC